MTEQERADQLADWKKAIAAKRRAQRQQRWKRPAPVVTGVVIRPAQRHDGDHA